jgi:hypothetical protein
VEGSDSTGAFTTLVGGAVVVVCLRTVVTTSGPDPPLLDSTPIVMTASAMATAAATAVKARCRRRASVDRLAAKSPEATRWSAMPSRTTVLIWGTSSTLVEIRVIASGS